MKTIKVFVSSPGDVQAERTIADRLIRAIAEELGIPISVQYSNLLRDSEPIESQIISGEPESGELILCPYFWEYQRFSPELGYQDQIPNTSRFDLVISILWSRLGTKLHSRFRMPDGTEPRSGTEYEIAWAMAQRQKTPGAPALQVYRNRSQPNPPLDPPEKREEFFRQWDLLKNFFESWEKDSKGQFIGAFNNYENLEGFEGLLREHFQDFLLAQVSDERQRRWLAERVRARRWKENPFRGLQVFDFEHAPVFAGRTLAVDGALTALIQQAKAGRPFVLVLGASGSGKSSLVRAGVLPLLIEPGVIEGIGLWRRSVMHPAMAESHTDMFDAFAAGLLAEEALPNLADLESKQPVKDLAADLRANPQGVADRVKDKLNQISLEYCLRQEEKLRKLESDFRQQQRDADAANARLQREKLQAPRTRLVLIVDQLEELFTSGFSEELQLKFISALSVLARGGRVWVLATLRNDFYARYQQFNDLVELVKPAGKFDLRPPTPDEIGNMIRLPAEAAGVRFEQEQLTGQRLDEALRDAAATTPESLPLLEHVLSLLYEKQVVRGDDLLRWSDYRELGELKGALAKYAEAVFSTLGPDEQRAFPLVMRYLVTLGQGEEEVPNRRTVPYRSLVVSARIGRDQKTGAQGFVDLFIEKRLLVADTDPHGEVTVTVAHEALLREWQRVKEWLSENREFLRMRDRLDSSLRLWLSRGKQKDDLLGPGLPLAEGEKLVKDFGLSLSQEQTNYVYTSIAERKRRKQVQERIRYAVTAAISVLAIVAGFQWFQAERQRQSAAQVTAKLQEQLRQASWASFNQAERQFQLGEWLEGIALLTRAIKFDPENQVASERFFQELIVHRDKALPLLIASFAHQDVVRHAAFSPDGTQILTASWDKTAKLWDAASGELMASFAHQGTVNAAAFSRDGTRILTASADKTAKLWDAASGKLITSFAHQGTVNAAAFSPDGTRILTASADKTAKLWDAASGKLITSFAHQDEVNAVGFAPDGARILTASADKTAKLWDAISAKLIASFAHQGIVYHGAFSPDGARILTASKDNTAKVWDAASGQLIISFDHKDRVYEAAFSPDGARILTVSADKTAKLWDASSGELIASFEHQDGIYHGAFSPDGARILTAGWDNIAKLWDAVSGKLITSFAHQNEVQDAAFSPDGARILTASWDKTAKLWDAASGEPMASFAHQDGVYQAAFSPDGARILTGSADKTAKLWDTASGKLITSFAHQDGVYQATSSPDGARILTASADKTAKLWDAASGKLISSFAHQGTVNAATFSPDGARVLTASADNTAKLWDASSGKLVASFAHQDGVYRATFSPDGTRILTASADNTAKLWGASSGKLVASFEHQDGVHQAEFSSDGTRILTASADNTAKLWDASSGKLISSFVHQDGVYRATFSPDGTRILTTSADNTAKLWDASSGKLIASFEHQGGVYQAEFSPDGTRILTASADNTAKLWDMPSGKLIASFAHHDSVRWAVFSPDGTRILTASWDKTARLWDAAIPRDLARQVKEWVGDTTRTGSSVSMASSPALQLESLSDIASGLQFSKDGSLVVINEERRSQLAKEMKKLAQDLRPKARFIRWFFTAGGDRTIFPASEVKIAEWVDDTLLTNPNVTEEWLRNALVYLPDYPLLHIALAGFETNSKRADFLRSFGLARLPKNSVFCARAGEMLLAQHQPELALAAVDKALLADPTDPHAQSLRRKILEAMPR
jgi:WD40 repeat protein/tetratricopeptide (TPR) repeat protein